MNLKNVLTPLKKIDKGIVINKVSLKGGDEEAMKNKEQRQSTKLT